MQKTREDFVGSTITQNVKYSDNGWQCYGSVDRKSVYSSESILDLILEDYQYDRAKSCYNYYPRADVPGTNCSAATLSHDIILINSLIYRSSNNTSYCSVQNLTNYLSYGILITNPVYNPLSQKGYKKIIDLDKWIAKDKGTTLDDFISTFLPESYINGTWVKGTEVTEQGSQFLCDILSTKYVGSVGKLTPATTLKEFATLVEEAGLKDKFEEDFALPMHDPESVKLPFYPRTKSEDEMEANLSAYFTRLFANLTLSNVFTNTQSKYYIEYLTDAYENLLATNSKLTDLTGADKSEASDFPAGSIYSTDVSADATDDIGIDTYRMSQICNAIIDNNEAMVGGYGNFLPELYLDELDEDGTTGLTYQNSFGIHLINPIDKTTVFREDDIKFDVYGSLLIGYNYVDALLSQRTFIGSVLTCLSYADGKAQDGETDSDKVTYANIGTITQNDPFNKFQKSSYYEFFRRVTGEAYDKGSYTGYMSVSTLMALAYLGQEGVLPPINAVDASQALEFTDDYEPIAEWLQNETFLIKAPIYGDFVEPTNFDQDLHPSASVTFKNLRLQKTENTINPYDDSKTEVPYVAKTNPLINLSSQEKGFGVPASRYLPGLGNIADEGAEGNKTSPAFLYDYNKGDEEDSIAEADEKTMTSGKSKQRVRSPNGGLTIEGELESPTIDELWIFLKYLTESTGYNNTKEENPGTINRELPSFYGVKASSVNVTESPEKAIVNPSASGSSDVSEIDILDWSPIANKDYTSFFDSDESKEFQYAGFQVTKYIPKVEDYKVSLFGRSNLINVFGQTYEYNTEKGVYSEVNNYMVPVLNQTILALDSDVESEWDTKTKSFADTLWLDTTSSKAVDAYGTKHSEQQEKIQKLLHTIFDYRADDTLHNHYKKYMPNPKNLKTIERDLETIRQNLQTFAEYVVATSVLKGSLDRQTNRGTLHTLHRNFHEFESTFLPDTTTALRDATAELDDEKNPLVTLEEDVTAIDKKVVYKDGNFETRYKHENFDAYNFDHSGTKTNTRAKKTGDLRLIPNETLLSEVYLGADGLYHSVHEYLIAPIVETEY